MIKLDIISESRFQDRDHQTKAEAAVETVFEGMRRLSRRGIVLSCGGLACLPCVRRKTGIGRNPRNRG